MALNKLIVQPNGIETNYHRITMLNILVNQENIIEVASYLNSDSRNKQKIFESGNDNSVSMPYMDVSAYIVPYDETMSIKGAYHALKQLSKFEGATDVFEEGQTLSLSE